MWRYLRLYLYFMRFSFSRAMEFRFDFFFRVGMDIIWYGIHLAFFTVLFRHTGLLGGWDLDQCLVFAASLFVTDAIQMTVFSNNLWWLPIFVNRGDVDYYLVRPVSSLFFLSTRDFAANSFLNLVLAIGVLIWALVRYPEPFTAGQLTLFIGLLLAGALLSYVVQMIFIIPVFWLQSRAGLREISWSFSRFGSRPHRIYTGWVRRVLVSVLPYAFMASYPVFMLLEGMTPRLLLHTAAVVVGPFLFMLWFWSRALRSYASASS
ncbi:MAG: ABC transporter permease [Planctomycetota bacterium]|jgi:ABC-2 type transport system permease protein